MVILGVDVGSVRRSGGFSWASSDGLSHGSDDPSELARFIGSALATGERVALAVECPLAIPVPATDSEHWRDLGRAREGEGNRPWSAGAGAGALATGLVQLAWLCAYLTTHSSLPIKATTQLETFRNGRADLLVTEAMVTSDGKPESVDGLQDHADAVAAAKRLDQIIEDTSGTPSEVHCGQNTAMNLAAAACLHAGMDIDPTELRLDIVVAKSHPQSPI